MRFKTLRSILESVVTFKLNFDVDAILLPRCFNLEPVLGIFTHNYDGWEQKIFKLHSLPENAKNMSIFRVYCVATYVDG